MPLGRRPFLTIATTTGPHYPSGSMRSLRQEREFRCEECRRPWLQADKRWQAYWIDDGPEDKLLFYCSECAEREFGEVGSG
jgi:hypothetical protein